ncbi:MAG: GerMN domain-containing protein, partial [Ilumatobacteraceae bacterium]
MTEVATAAPAPAPAWRRLLVAASGILVGAVPSACAIASEDVARDIPVLQQVELGVDSGSQAGEAAGQARIYLLVPDAAGDATAITAVSRDVDESPAALLGALLAGPNDDELDGQLRTAIPDGTVLRSAQLRSGTLVVDVSATLLELSDDSLVAALAQIVFTATEVAGVRSVRVLVDGADRQWPAAG